MSFQNEENFMIPLRLLYEISPIVEMTSLHQKENLSPSLPRFARNDG